MEGKVSVGETLRETFAVYRAHAGVLLPLAFWLFLISAVAEALTLHVLALFWLAPVVGLTVVTLYQGTVVRLVQDLQDGHRDSSVQDLMRSVLPVFWPLLGAAFVVAFGVIGGLVLLVAPGLYLLAMWAVVAPVIVVERCRVFDGLGRSRQLVRGNGWPVLGAVLVGFLIGAVASLGLSHLAEAIFDGEIVHLVFRVLAQTLAAPIAALIASVLYFRLLEIHARRPATPAADDLPPRLPTGLAEGSVPQQPGDGLG
ncbi:MAG TPA: hypothetical protein VFP17_10840 [Solirubrobacterales bacterium]|nr:hypothetical protein [Solirubrobacterales bacterium]